MNISRRGFLGALAATPLAHFAVPPAAAEGPVYGIDPSTFKSYTTKDQFKIISQGRCGDGYYIEYMTPIKSPRRIAHFVCLEEE